MADDPLRGLPDETPTAQASSDPLRGLPDESPSTTAAPQSTPLWQRAAGLVAAPIGAAARAAQEVKTGAQAIYQDPWGVAKDVARGVGGGLLGLAEVVPNVPFIDAFTGVDAHKAAADLSRMIHEGVQYEPAYQLGTVAPLLAGGEWSGVRGAMSLVPKVAEGASGFLAGTGRFASSIGRGIVGGAVAGAESGMLTPTGDESYLGAMGKKLKAAGEEAAGGALLGGSLGSAADIAGKGARFTKTAIGTKAAEAAGTLQKEATEATRAAAGTAAERAEKAKAAEEAAKTKIEAKNAEIQETVQKTQETIKQVEATAAEDQRRAVEAASRAKDVEGEAQKIAEDMAHGGGAETSTSLGNRIQTTASKLYKRLDEAREKAADFGGALSSAGDVPIADTTKALDYIKSQKPRVSKSVEKLLDYYGSQLKTIEKEGDKDVSKSALSIYKANAVRKEINEAIRTKRVKIEGTDSALDKDAAHHLREVERRLTASARQAHAPFDEAMRKYAEYSKPMKPFKPKGPLHGIVQTEDYSDEFKMLVGDVTAKVLQRTGKGSSAFAHLIQENPELRDAVRGYYRRELYGEGDLAQPASSNTTRNFLLTHGESLKQTGLYKEFYDAHSKLVEAEARAATAGLEAKAAKESASATKATTKDARGEALTKMRVETAVARGDLRTLRSELKDAVREGRTAERIQKSTESLADLLERKDLDVKDVVKRVENAYKDLYDSKLLSRDEWLTVTNEIDKSRALIKDRDVARKWLRHAYRAALITAVGYATLRDLHLTTGL